MKRIFSVCLIVLLIAFHVVPGSAETDPPVLENILQEKPDTWSCTFDGVKHTFVLELPDEPAGAPLAVLLPGYGNTAEAFRTAVRFEKEANALGYAVVYVTGAPDPSAPSSAVCWNSDPGSSGNRDVEFLKALACYLQETWAFDPSRTYAAGFSNGAFMTHRLAMEASDTFSAVVSVAGLMPKGVWDRRGETSRVSVFQITGEKDEAVPKKSDGSARYAIAPAIEDVMDYWVSSNGLVLQDTSSIGNGSVLTKYGRPDSPVQVWNLFVHEGRHSWPEVRISGFSTNSLILEFFEAQKG